MKYRKKPVVIEAEQYVKGSASMPRGVCLEKHLNEDWVHPHVHTIHNNQVVLLESGDWVIPEPDGIHFYPVKPDIFAATYETVTE